MTSDAILIPAFLRDPARVAAELRWTSNAEWPKDLQLGTANPVTQDTHNTRQEALAECAKLEKHGFGGEGKIFPVRTWVKPLTEQ